MKIEKISDTQIRCTLNKDDLIERELKLSELAYGTEKSKALFRDLIQQASYECGFDTDDLPLMIEAIPVSPECLVLVLTKVEDPEELDTRFSNFTPYGDSDEDSESDSPAGNAYADEILNCFDKLGHMLDTNKKENSQTEEKPADKKRKKPQAQKAARPSITITATLAKVYSFQSLSEVSALSAVIAPFYRGKSILYKDPVQARYYLVLHISNHTPEDFNKVCNIASEYGTAEQTNYASLPYYEEHYETVIRSGAVEIMSNF